MKRFLSSEGLRFLFSGGVLFILDFTAFVIFRKVFGIEVVYSEFLARLFGASMGFLLHKFFTFANPRGSSAMSTRVQGAGYFIIMGVNLVLSPFLVSWLVFMMHPYELLAKGLGSALIACETFIVFRFLFRGSKDESQPELKLSGQ